MRRFWTHGVIATALLLCVAQASAATVLIDEFADFQLVKAFGPLGSQSNVAAGSMIGGERDMILNVLGGAASQNATVAAFDNNGASSLFYSQQTTITSKTTIVWDGTDNAAGTIAYTGLGGVDLTGGGDQKSFEFGVKFYDRQTALTVTVYDASDATGNTWSRGTVHLGATQNSSSYVPSTKHIAFSHLDAVGPNGGANFTNIGAITLEIGATNVGSDTEIDYIRTSTVPEPQSIVMALVGSVLCGFGYIRRRRNQK